MFEWRYEMLKTRTKMVRLTEEELTEINRRAEQMHLSASQLLVLGALNWDGRITTRESNISRVKDDE